MLIGLLRPWLGDLNYIRLEKAISNISKQASKQGCVCLFLSAFDCGCDVNFFEVPALTSPPLRGWNLELYTEETLPPLCCCLSGNFIMATEMELEQSVFLV